MVLVRAFRFLESLFGHILVSLALTNSNSLFQLVPKFATLPFMRQNFDVYGYTKWPQKCKGLERPKSSHGNILTEKDVLISFAIIIHGLTHRVVFA